MDAVVGTVAELWRYPVKSLRGEQLETLDLDSRGVVADRAWAVIGEDGKIGSGKTTRRFRRMPGLLDMAARLDHTGVLEIRFPDGTSATDRDDVVARMREILGEPVTLEREASVAHHDDAAVHLLSTNSLRWLQAHLPHDAIDVRRVRPNLLISSHGPGLDEEQWLGRGVEVGTVRLQVEKRTERCVMTTMAQDDLPSAPGVVSTLESLNDFCLGVYASVVSAGSVSVGDAVTVL